MAGNFLSFIYTDLSFFYFLHVKRQANFVCFFLFLFFSFFPFFLSFFLSLFFFFFKLDNLSNQLRTGGQHLFPTATPGLFLSSAGTTGCGVNSYCYWALQGLVFIFIRNICPAKTIKGTDHKQISNITSIRKRELVS